MSEVSDVADRSRAILDAGLEEQLLNEGNRGRFVAIDPDSGAFVTGDTMGEASERLRGMRPDALGYIGRLGSDAAVSFSGRPAFLADSPAGRSETTAVAK